VVYGEPLAFREFPFGSTPEVCDPQAYKYFASQMPVVETDDGLEHASLAMAMHVFDCLKPETMLGRFDELASRVLQRVRSHHHDALLAHLHDVLFDEEGYCGFGYDQTTPIYGLLPSVVDLKCGNAIVLALIYKAVARRVGLRVVGVNFRERFAVAVTTKDQVHVIDVSASGRVMDRSEWQNRLTLPPAIDELAVPAFEDGLPRATHRQWLSRMLAQLQHAYALGGYRTDLAAMTELHDLLFRVPV